MQGGGVKQLGQEADHHPLPRSRLNGMHELNSRITPIYYSSKPKCYVLAKETSIRF